MRNIQCPRCGNTHEYEEYVDNSMPHYQRARCPITYGKISWDFRPEGLKLYKHVDNFGNNIGYSSFVKLFYGQLFNRGYKMIIFNAKGDFVVTNHDNEIIPIETVDKWVKPLVEDVIENTEMYPTGKNLLGNDLENGCYRYLCRMEGFDYDLSQLMKLHFNNHGGIPDRVLLTKCCRILNPELSDICDGIEKDPRYKEIETN